MTAPAEVAHRDEEDLILSSIRARLESDGYIVQSLYRIGDVVRGVLLARLTDIKIEIEAS